MTTTSRRLAILSAQEIEDLYGRPRFTEEDRRLYFALSPQERAAVDAVHTTSAAVHLTLQLGYFKANRRFFVYTREAVREDLEHIRHRYFPTRDLGDITALSKPTRLDQQRIILTLFTYGLCDAAAKVEVEQKAQRAAMLSTQPIFILRYGVAVSDHAAHRCPRVYLLTGYGGARSLRRAAADHRVARARADASCRATCGDLASGRRGHVPPQRAQARAEGF